jgi:hypothetical protein
MCKCEQLACSIDLVTVWYNEKLLCTFKLSVVLLLTPIAMMERYWAGNNIWKSKYTL